MKVKRENPPDKKTIEYMDRGNIQLSCTGKTGIELLIESHWSFFLTMCCTNCMYCLRSEVISGFFPGIIYVILLVGAM